MRPFLWGLRSEWKDCNIRVSCLLTGIVNSKTDYGCGQACREEVLGGLRYLDYYGTR